jgi:hypothetical protein
MEAAVFQAAFLATEEDVSEAALLPILSIRAWVAQVDCSE